MAKAKTVAYRRRTPRPSQDVRPCDTDSAQSYHDLCQLTGIKPIRGLSPDEYTVHTRALLSVMGDFYRDQEESRTVMVPSPDACEEEWYALAS